MAERVRTLREGGDLRKGLKKAYSHVFSNLMYAINEYERRGLTEDPGYSVAQAASNDCRDSADRSVDHAEQRHAANDRRKC